MAKIKNESTPEGDAKLVRETRAARRAGWGDKEIGSGGQRTRADGVTVNGRDTNDDRGWTTSR